jgi:hypothetical protein
MNRGEPERVELDVRSVVEEEAPLLERHLARRAPGRHRARLALQARDEVVCVVAWRGDTPVGRVLLEGRARGTAGLRPA